MNAIKKYSLIVLFQFLAIYSYSQGCAMCAATVETNLAEGGMKGAGINTGVLYLSAFPYIMFAFFVFIIHRTYKKAMKEKLERENQ